MNTMTGAAPSPKRTQRQKLAKEYRLLRRDGVRRYVRTLRALRRFHRSVTAMNQEQS